MPVLPNLNVSQDLDTQYTIGLASDVPVYFISVGPDTTDGIYGFLDLVNFLESETNPPCVLAISYGFNENEITALLAMCVSHFFFSLRYFNLLDSSVDFAMPTWHLVLVERPSWSPQVMVAFPVVNPGAVQTSSRLSPLLAPSQSPSLIVAIRP